MHTILQKIFKSTSIYMQASLDVYQSLELVQKRIKSKKAKAYLEKILTELKSGKAISESFRIFKDKRHLDSVAWSMLVSAELSGNLAKVFGQIHTYMKSQSEIQKSFISSLAYPIGVVSMSLLMIYFLMTSIFPKITPLFASLQAPIPPATKALLLISDFLRTHSIQLFVGSFIFSALAYGLYKRNAFIKILLQRVLFKIPIASSIFKMKELHRISLSCGFLMKSNKTLLEAIHICTDTSSYAITSKMLQRTAERLEFGQKISDAVRPESLFDDEWVDMVTVGEISGTLPQTFSDLATFYEALLKEDFERLAKWSEPVALAGSAGVILIVALSVIQPMYSIIQFVQPQ